MVNERWAHIGEMFPNGGTFLEGQWYSNAQLKNLPELTQINSYLMKPVRRMTEKEWEITWYDNGDMDFFQTYSVFPHTSIDDKPLFNAYGSRIMKEYWDGIKNIYGEFNETTDTTLENELRLDYSSL